MTVTLKDILSLRFWFVRVWYRSIARCLAARAYINEWEYITHVAIVLESGELFELPRPYRHHHCIKIAFKKYGEQVICSSQGFMTSTGRYVDRQEGLAIAKAAKQLLSRHFHQRDLFSESLW